MKNIKKETKAHFSTDLDALFDNARPMEELDLESLAQAFDELDHDPAFVADSSKGVFVEDILRALAENTMSKSELARRMGKTRQQINTLLDDEKKNNFTIETMAKVSTALGRQLFVRMLASEEHVRITTHEPVEQSQTTPKSVCNLLKQKWKPEKAKLGSKSMQHPDDVYKTTSANVTDYAIAA